MYINDLSPVAGSTHVDKRKGRGHATGNGKTAGRGHKGFCKKTRKRIAFSESEHNNLVLSPSRMKSCASLYQKSHIQAYI